MNGTSVSVFYKLEFDVNPKDLENFTKTFERETILSTGGDYGVPGFQIYRDGPILGALLSTGDETWEVRIVVRGSHGFNFRSQKLTWLGTIAEYLVLSYIMNLVVTMDNFYFI